MIRMSFAYARIGRDDDRVKTVIDWLGRNYTLNENPGMGAEGAYYYHLTVKALRTGREGTDCTRWRNNRLARGILSQAHHTTATRRLMAKPHQALDGRQSQIDCRLSDNDLDPAGRKAVDLLGGEAASRYAGKYFRHCWILPS